MIAQLPDVCGFRRRHHAVPRVMLNRELGEHVLRSARSEIKRARKDLLGELHRCAMAIRWSPSVSRKECNFAGVSVLIVVWTYQSLQCVIFNFFERWEIVSRWLLLSL